VPPLEKTFVGGLVWEKNLGVGAKTPHPKQKNSLTLPDPFVIVFL